MASGSKSNAVPCTCITRVESGLQARTGPEGLCPDPVVFYQHNCQILVAALHVSGHMNLPASLVLLADIMSMLAAASGWHACNDQHLQCRPALLSH